MTTAVNEFQQIQKHAESIKNDETHRIETWSPGDCWAQGDLLLVCLEKVPQGAEVIKVDRQLAPGTTQGSRHCLVSLDGVTMYRLANATALDGPIVEAKSGCEIDHPEHGNLIVPPGVFGVVYQRQYAEELRRVLD